jgi:elongation factor Ts
MKNIEKIKKLREETGAGVMEVKQTLEEFDGDYDKAYEDLMKKVSAKAAKKADRTAGDGLVYSYIHNNGKLGSLIVVACETDFVAKTDDFQNLCKEIAMQVCTDDYERVADVVKAPYMRDESKTVGDLIEEAIAKLGEKIELKKFTKYSVSDE